jgi:FkbM family methyltransferase
LLANVGLNGLQNVTIRSEALGAASEDVSFYLGPPDDTGLASLRSLADSNAMTVRQARFDDVWDRGPVTLVKIDVEGAEMRVLVGMDACLAAAKPDLIVEFTDEFLRGVGDSAESLYQWLSTRGYRVFQIGCDGGLNVIDSPQMLMKCPPQFNALCSTTTRTG